MQNVYYHSKRWYRIYLSGRWFPQVMILALVATSLTFQMDHGRYHIVLHPISQPHRFYYATSKPSSIPSVQEKEGLIQSMLVLKPGHTKTIDCRPL